MEIGERWVAGSHVTVSFGLVNSCLMSMYSSAIMARHASLLLVTGEADAVFFRSLGTIACFHVHSALLCSALHRLIQALAYVSNYIEVRIDATRVMYEHRRPFPRGAQDIGTWQLVWTAIAIVAVGTNAGLVSHPLRHERHERHATSCLVLDLSGNSPELPSPPRRKKKESLRG